MGYFYEANTAAATGYAQVNRNKIPGLFILKGNHKIEEVINFFRIDNKDGSGGCHDLNEA